MGNGIKGNQNLLSELDLFRKVMRTTEKCYKEQTFCIWMENEFLIRTKVERVDRWRMFFSSFLFNVTREAILSDLEITPVFIIGRHNPNKIGYADDTVLIAVRNSQLHLLLQRLLKESDKKLQNIYCQKM